MQLCLCSALSNDHEAALFFQLEGPTKRRIKQKDKGHNLMGATKTGEISVLVFTQDQRQQCCTHARLPDISTVAQKKDLKIKSDSEQTLRVCSANKAAAAEPRAETRTHDHVALLNHCRAAANLHIDGEAR